MGCGAARACLAWQGKGGVKSFGALDIQAQGAQEITPDWARLDDGKDCQAKMGRDHVWM